MKMCRVLGSVVGTVHHPVYDSHKLMVVQPEDPSGQAIGDSYLAVDHVQAGTGDRVLVLTEGNGVRQILKTDPVPIRSIIVGIVDQVDLGT